MTNNNHADFQRRIRAVEALRDEHKLTQAELADIVNKSQGAVSKALNPDLTSEKMLGAVEKALAKWIAARPKPMPPELEALIQEMTGGDVGAFLELVRREKERPGSQHGLGPNYRQTDAIHELLEGLPEEEQGAGSGKAVAEPEGYVTEAVLLGVLFELLEEEGFTVDLLIRGRSKRITRSLLSRVSSVVRDTSAKEGSDKNAG